MGAKVLQVGMHVDRYELVRPIGRGAMGEVWRARHRYTQADCAIKTLHAQLATSQRVADLFVQEAHVGARLAQHPNIVRVQDAGHDPEVGLPFLVMELLEGETLEERRQREGPLPWELGRVLFEQLGDAVQSAHEAQVIHRDLKPGNLFLTRDRKGAPLLKVLDFGIARVLEEDAARTATQMGTPAYAAPEQLGPTYRNMAERQGVTIAKQVSAATDVWAFGLVVYDLLTGAEPGTFWGVQTAAELPVRIALEDAPRPSEPATQAGVSLPRGFDEWFSRCVARDARQRYSTFDEAAHVLVDLLGGPVSVRGARAGARSTVVSAGSSVLSAPHTVETRFEVATLVPSDKSDKAAVAATLRSETTKRPADTAPVPTLAGASDAGSASSSREPPEAATEAPISSYRPKALWGAASTTGATAADAAATSDARRPKRRLVVGAAALALVLAAVGFGAWTQKQERAAEAAAEASARAKTASVAAAAAAAVAQEREEQLELEKLAQAAVPLAGEPVESGALENTAPTFRSACDKGNAEACTALGYVALYGIGGQVDKPKGLDLLDRACKAGSASACASLGQTYANGTDGAVQDKARAKALLEQAARLYQTRCEGSQPSACAALGFLYERGLGVDKDSSHATELFKKACDGGAVAGCARLAAAYASGNGVSKDQKRAVELFQKACEGGNARGCSGLASLLARGEGLAKDAARAAELGKKGCDGGVMLGCSVLGDAYAKGAGVPKDLRRAAELYQKACDSAAEQVPSACTSLAALYENGFGAKQDVTKVTALYDTACKAGDKTACDINEVRIHGSSKPMASVLSNDATYDAAYKAATGSNQASAPKKAQAARQKSKASSDLYDYKE